MKTRNIYNVLYTVTDWMVKLGYLNILWASFTILGLGVFGLFPASFSVYAIVRKWLDGERNINLFKTFKTHYFKEFFITNLLGVITSILITLFALNIVFYTGFEHKVSDILMSLFGALLIITITLALYLLPLFASVRLKFFDYFKAATYIIITHPVQALALLVFTPVYGMILLTLPFLIPFFSVSIFAVISTWIVRNSFTPLIRKISHQ
ncbi:YesL family protein [Salinicoccus sp. YB14-2]|uniref:YesL family protein n=1 Tax=Salinicoccus sp. YB14-2 TaxID=1572701 RepID=UPI0006894C53|nr:DUF624 domain-containing protein [Salinicoccus sp. YB14-2]